jgi:Flp pilus assembly protein TadG
MGPRAAHAHEKTDVIGLSGRCGAGDHTCLADHRVETLGLACWATPLPVVPDFSTVPQDCAVGHRRATAGLPRPKLPVSPERQCSERGVALVLFTLLIAFVIVPMMGLGIDAGIQYWIKARLSSATDAAALAAARSLNVGSTIASQTANAQAVGRQYFAANFPTGILGTTVFGGAQVSNSASITVSAVSNYISVTATAQVIAPLYFMKVLHFPTGLITASSQTTRRNANIVLVLDRSGSMNNSSNSCSALIASVENFTNQFVDGRDEIGMVTFSTGAKLDYSPTIYFKSSTPSVNSIINSMVCVGATSTAQGLNTGYNAIKAINQPGALNVILFFTDGQANAIVANYPKKTAGDNRYDAVNTGTLEYVGPSSCWGTGPFVGGFTELSGGPNATGYTGGVYSVSPPSPITGGLPQPAAISGASGCMFSSTSSYGGAFGNWWVPYGRNDIAYIPTTDAYGNSTVGFKPSQTFPNGAYRGQIRTDSPMAIRYAAMNAADAQAQMIRSDSYYATSTYAIGLAGNESTVIDEDFMERIANDPRASNFDPGQPQGMFILASDNASLSDAFNAIASQILRLSK